MFKKKDCETLAAEGAVLFLVLLWLFCSPAFATTHDTGDLDLDPSHAPYCVKPIKTQRYFRNQPDMTSYLMADLEGDGQLELITGDVSRLLGWDCEDGYIKPRFQINLEPGWRFHHQAGANLGVSSDLNGDRTAEVHLTIVATDGSAWRFQTIDLATEQVIVDVPLPLGEDRRADGVWDGSYMPIGLVDDADGKGTPGVVLLRNASYDANPRGLVALNAHNGDLLWEWRCGPNPDCRHPVVADLDADGAKEIVLFGHSPDNLHGELINGTSDDHCYLFVIGATGQELWRQDLGGTFCFGSVLAADLDGDGQLEIISYTEIGQTGQANKMAVWDYSSRSLTVCQRQEATFMGVAVLPGPQPGTSWLVTGSNDGFVTRGLFADGKLIRERRRMTNYPACRVVGAVDILPEPGLEVLLDIGPGEVFAVLDAELNPLAIYEDGQIYSKGYPMLWQRTGRDLSLVVGESKAHFVLEFFPNPRRTPLAAKITASLAFLLVLLGGAFWIGRSVGRRTDGEVLTGAAMPQIADRAVLYRMWRQLDDVKHERFLETNRGLRRLVWLLEAYAADLGASETLGVRIGQLMDDFSDSVQPRLLEILQLARAENFETATVQRTTQALENLGRHLGSLNVETLTLESVQSRGDEMNGELGRVEEGFLHLWQALRRYFSTDPVRMLQGMLLVREVEFQRADVRTELVVADEDADPICLIDSSSLRFILENLVDNALRAMAESPLKVLRMEAVRSRKELILRISDTGKGVAPEVQKDIFNGRTSDRHGGGAGLFRTREILQKWRGEVLLDESRPGKGTTFVVKLRAATELESAAEDAPTLRGRG